MEPTSFFHIFPGFFWNIQAKYLGAGVVVFRSFFYPSSALMTDCGLYFLAMV
jgi:hypothetical protein